MDITNRYVDELYNAFTHLKVGERISIDLSQLGYSGDGEFVIPTYFLKKFAEERLTLGLREDGNFIQRAAGTPGIYFKS